MICPNSSFPTQRGHQLLAKVVRAADNGVEPVPEVKVGVGGPVWC